jgi:hypothetical protein
MADVQSIVGISLLAQMNYEAAEPLLVQGYAGLSQNESRLSPFAKQRIDQTGQHLIRLYEGWNKPEEANKWKAILRQRTEAQK